MASVTENSKSGGKTAGMAAHPTATGCFFGYLNHNILRAVARLEALVETFVGSKPNTITASTLPDLVPQNLAQGPGQVNVSIPIAYQTLTEQLTQVLQQGQRWLPLPDQPQLELLVKRVKIYPSGQRLVVVMQFVLPQYSGDTLILAYITGVPVVDNKTKIVSIRDVDFDATTGSFLTDSVLTPLKAYLKQKIGTKLVYNFNAEYAQLQ